MVVDWDLLMFYPLIISHMAGKSHLPEDTRGKPYGIWWDLPSGKRLRNYGSNHNAVDGNTHYFEWAIFNIYVKLPEGNTWNLMVNISYNMCNVPLQ